MPQIAAVQPAETPLCPLASVSAPRFPSLPAVHLKSQQPSVALPALRAPRGGPASRQAGGSSAFHAECVQVLVNCALTSQGGSGKAPLGLCCWEAQLGNPSPAAPGGCPPPPAVGSGGGSRCPAPLPSPFCLAAQAAGNTAWPLVLLTWGNWLCYRGPLFSPLQNGNARSSRKLGPTAAGPQAALLPSFFLVHCESGCSPQAWGDCLGWDHSGELPGVHHRGACFLEAQGRCLGRVDLRWPWDTCVI